jgi:hypothetical protein
MGLARTVFQDLGLEKYSACSPGSETDIIFLKVVVRFINTARLCDAQYVKI